MATISILRVAGGASLARLAAPQLLKGATPMAGMLIPKKTFMMTPSSQGRVYGPSPVPLPSTTGHWKQERWVMLALIPIIPACLVWPNAISDYILSAGICLHAHQGLSGVTGDYIHGSFLPKIVQPSVLLLGIIAFGGLCYLNYNDIGFAGAARLIYKEL